MSTKPPYYLIGLLALNVSLVHGRNYDVIILYLS